MGIHGTFYYISKIAYKVKKSVITGPKKIVPWFLRYVYCRAKSTPYQQVFSVTFFSYFLKFLKSSWTNENSDYPPVKKDFYTILYAFAIHAHYVIISIKGKWVHYWEIFKGKWNFWISFEYLSIERFLNRTIPIKLFKYIKFRKSIQYGKWFKNILFTYFKDVIIIIFQ